MKKAKLVASQSAYLFSGYKVDKEVKIPELVLKECNAFSVIFDIQYEGEDLDKFEI